MFTSISGFEERVKSDFSRFKGFEKTVEFTERSECKLRFRIYTFTNSYSIVAVIHQEPGRNNYLGCIASSRKPRAGENWTRGNDLPDGPLNVETWNKIKNAIVNYELVQIHTNKSPKVLNEDVV